MSFETLHLDKTAVQIAITVKVDAIMPKTIQLKSNIQAQGGTFWVIYTTSTDDIC